MTFWLALVSVLVCLLCLGTAWHLLRRMRSLNAWWYQAVQNLERLRAEGEIGLRELREAGRRVAEGARDEASSRPAEAPGSDEQTITRDATPGHFAPQAPDDSTTADAVQEYVETDPYVLAWGVETFFNSTKHPRELLSHEPFLKGVELFMNEAAYSTTDLTSYALSPTPVVACMALEATALRAPGADDDDTVARLIDGANEIYYWPRFFALRALDARARGPVVARLLARLNSGWRDLITEQFLREFIQKRLAAGEAVTPEEFLEHVSRNNPDELQLSDLQELLKDLSDLLPCDLADGLARWSAERVDLEFLQSFGRTWGPGETYAAESAVVMLEELDAQVSELEPSLKSEPPRGLLIVGDTGVGKTTLVRALARRLQKEDWTVFEASAADLMSGQQYIGMIEGRLQTLVRQLSDKRVLWVVPNFHEMLWAGRHSQSPTGILDMLLPEMERGKLRVVGEVPSAAYERLVRERPKLRAALQTFRVEPAGEEETLELGRRWAEQQDEGGAARLSEETLREAMQLSNQYLNDKAAPGNLLLLLETAHRRARSDANRREPQLTPDDLLVTVSQLTGLPVILLDERRGLDLSELHAFFGRRVLGQPEAVDCLVERVAMMKAGLTDPTRPQGVFLFVGPTGTGKTEIAKTLAEFLFGSPERMIRLDMSEFQTPDTLDRILGEAAELSESTALVNLIRKQPFSVVLLDEFEKAHPQVWDLFLQVFDDGRLTDRRGNTADFRHSVIIMTSNLGATLPHGASIGFSQEQAQFASASVERAVMKSFRREFVNRIDRIVVFRPLGLAVMRDLLRKELNDVLNRRGLRKRQWAVEWDESAIEFLLRKGFTADLGARPLKRAVERYLLSPLAMTIVNHQFPEGDQFLFVRSLPDGDGLAVQFVDPDAPDETEERDGRDAQADDGESADLELRLERIALDPRGTPEEVKFLREKFGVLDEGTRSAEWREMKDEALRQMQTPSFWSSPERFAVLGRAEYADRMEAGLDTAGSLLNRLGGSRTHYPPALVSRVAEQLYLLDAARAGLNADQPRDAFLRVRACHDAGCERAASDLFARRVAAMYRRWAEKRRMRLDVLEESGGEAASSEADTAVEYEALMAVSGFAAYTILRAESGLHVLESRQDEKSFNRVRAHVRVVPQPEEPAGHAPGDLLRQARLALEAGDEQAQQVVRRYREEPSPLVRDSVRGWRTGKIERVFDGDFDLIT